MNTLFGMTLPHQIQWKEQYQARRHASARHTLSGGLVLSARSGYQSVTLMADPDLCWIDKGTAEALLAHAQANPTSPGVLVLDGKSYPAVWRHDEADGAVALSPITPFADLLVGELRLYIEL